MHVAHVHAFERLWVGFLSLAFHASVWRAVIVSVIILVNCHLIYSCTILLTVVAMEMFLKYSINYFAAHVNQINLSVI